jgi:hypothetical protein
MGATRWGAERETTPDKRLEMPRFRFERSCTGDKGIPHDLFEKTCIVIILA